MIQRNTEKQIHVTHKLFLKCKNIYKYILGE